MMLGLCSMMIGLLLFTVGVADEPTDNANENAAIEALKKLGARVVFKPLESDKDKTRPQLWFVRIDRNWEGGDEGLKHILRLPKLSTLYIVGRPEVSDEGLAKLKKAMPDLAVERRTGAFLGVNPVSRNGSVVLLRVLPNSPADKAGLKPDDLIQKIDQTAISNANELITAIETKEPDDEVDVIVRRKDMSVTVKVKLGTWPK